MIFVREGSAAVVLVTLTLSLQCAGMAAMIAWTRTSLAPDVHRLGPLRSALLMVRLMTAFIGLHAVESIIGVLMCGLSASFLFAIVTRLVEREARVSDTPVTDTGDTSPGTRIRQSISRLTNANF